MQGKSEVPNNLTDAKINKQIWAAVMEGVYRCNAKHKWNYANK